MHVGAALFEINVFFVIICVLYITIKQKSRLLSSTLFFFRKKSFFLSITVFSAGFQASIRLFNNPTPTFLRSGTAETLAA